VGGGITAPTTQTSAANPINTISYGSIVFGGAAGSTTSASQSLPTPSNLLGGAATVSTQSVFEAAAVVFLIGFILWKKGVFHGLA
jgi:hypothetical protein